MRKLSMAVMSSRGLRDASQSSISVTLVLPVYSQHGSSQDLRQKVIDREPEYLIPVTAVLVENLPHKIPSEQCLLSSGSIISLIFPLSKFRLHLGLPWPDIQQGASQLATKFRGTDTSPTCLGTPKPKVQLLVYNRPG